MTVEYLDAEPNGLAAMLGGLIEANLLAHPERARLLAGRAVYVISAPDADAAISVRLGEGRVRVRNGAVSRADLRVEAPSEVLIGLSSVPLRFGLPDSLTPEGREVNARLLRRELRVRGLLRHPAKLGRLNRLLSVL